MVIINFILAIDIIYTAGIGGEFLGCGCPGEEGGIARIAYYIKNTPHQLLIDAGGIFGKNRFVDSIAVTNLTDYGFDALCVSPDELIFGPEFITRLNSVAPFLCSNVRYSGAPIAREYIIKDCNGVKVVLTAVIEEGIISGIKDLEVSESEKAINHIKSLPEIRDYDFFINIKNGRDRTISIEKIGAVKANWSRRIGLLRIEKNNLKNTVTFLDSTIPEDSVTRVKINLFLDYLHSLPAQKVISDFPARVPIVYYYNNEDDSVMKYLLPTIVKRYYGMVGVTYIKKTEAMPGLKIKGEVYQGLSSDSIITFVNEKIYQAIENGGDNNVQVVYFPNINCPECERYNLLLKAFATANPEITVVSSLDEVLLERFYEVYCVPPEKRLKPIIFMGIRYLGQEDIRTKNLYVEGKIPWLKIYGIEK